MSLGADSLTAGSVSAPAAVEPVITLTPGGSVWVHWSYNPLIWGGLALMLWLFLRGMKVRGIPFASTQAISFLFGLALIWLMLITPLDYIARHLFGMRQGQILVLHIIAPIAIFFAAPQATLFAGMPRRMRHLVLAPMLRDRALRQVGRALSQPVVATALYILSLTLWLLPPLQNAAVLHPGIGRLMVATMLLTGCALFRIIFDPRDEPQGLGFGYRQMIIATLIITHIGTGAVISLTSRALYPAYDQVGRLFGIAALPDETNGGFLIWVPSALVLALAVLLVMHRWNGAEHLRWKRTGTHLPMTGFGNLISPQTAEELWMLVTPRNRKVGIGLGLVAVMMFVMIMGMAQMVHMASAGAP
ncbi:MAG: cytochrome c oxidase assembly protein [Maritimibacter sp.]